MLMLLPLETLHLDAITFTVCTALNADFVPMHRLQPFRSVNNFSDSTPVCPACEVLPSANKYSSSMLDTLVTNTAFEHGCHFLTPVFTGRGHGT